MTQRPSEPELSAHGSAVDALDALDSLDVLEARRLAVLHLDTVQQSLLTPADREARPMLVEQVRRLEVIAARAGIVLPIDALRIRGGLGPLETNVLVLASVNQMRTEMAGAGLTLGEALAMQLVDPIARLEALSLFRSTSPLRRQGLLDLYRKDAVAPTSDLMRRELSVPEHVQAFLVGDRALGDVLSGIAQFAPDAPYPSGPHEVLPAELELAEVVSRWLERDGTRAMGLEVVGPPGSGKTTVVRKAAQAWDVPLIEVDALQLGALNGRVARTALDVIYSAAALYRAWVVIDRADVIEPGAAVTRALSEKLSGVGTVTVLLSPGRLPLSHPLAARVLQHVELGVPGEHAREALWNGYLDAEQVSPADGATMRLVAGKFELTPGQIENSARLVSLRSPSLEVQPDFEQLEARAFEQLRGNLGELASVRQCTARFEDLVLPETEKQVIREIIRAARYRTELLHGWQFKQRFNYGTGIVALFSGEPGTGKTYGAEIIAGELDLQLYQIAVPQVVSKWVGETEKQISRIFNEARASRALLLFDEADSLFGSRTEVRTASDRYANMATNYLLQAIEAHEGVVILTTNLEENLDAAAERRILFRMRFPFPDGETRAELWRRMLPPSAPVSKDIDFEELGELYELSGGHIKNAIIRAAYDALERKDPLDMETLQVAAEREARMTGRLVRRWSDRVEQL